MKLIKDETANKLIDTETIKRQTSDANELAAKLQPLYTELKQRVSITFKTALEWMNSGPKDFQASDAKRCIVLKELNGTVPKVNGNAITIESYIAMRDIPEAEDVAEIIRQMRLVVSHQSGSMVCFLSESDGTITVDTDQISRVNTFTLTGRQSQRFEVLNTAAEALNAVYEYASSSVDMPQISGLKNSNCKYSVDLWALLHA